MYAIFKKEMRTYFNTLTGYAFLGFFVLITGYFFVSQNISQLNGNYSDTLAGSLIMFLILIPVLTMRLFAEEARQKTDQLLLSSPISIYDIVIGKFLAAICLYLIGLAITMVFPFILNKYGAGGFSATAGAVIGYFLMGACFIAVGIFISVLTDNQIVAAAATFAVLFALLMMDNIINAVPIDLNSSLIFVGIIIALIAVTLYNSTKNILFSALFLVLGLGIEAILYFVKASIFDGIIVRVLGWFSILSRFESFYMGIFGISDVVYYITFAVAFLYLTVNVIEKRRWS